MGREFVQTSTLSAYPHSPIPTPWIGGWAARSAIIRCQWTVELLVRSGAEIVYGGYEELRGWERVGLLRDVHRLDCRDLAAVDSGASGRGGGHRCLLHLEAETETWGMMPRTSWSSEG